MTIEVEVCGRTDVGLERDHNEDSFLVTNLDDGWRAAERDETRTLTVGAKGIVVAVCDGMGGAAAGEVASKIAVDTLATELAAPPPVRDEDPKKDRLTLGQRLLAATSAANSKIWQTALAERAKSGMGTTASAALLQGHTLLIAQVGDSRLYLWRAGKLKQVTRDQSLAGALVESGTLDESQARDFIHSNVILQALGVEPDVSPTISWLELRRGDTVLLCSDGLSGPVDDQHMAEILGAHPALADAGAQLIEAAKDQGAPDNVTVVLARFGGDGLPELGADEPLATGVLEPEELEPDKPRTEINTKRFRSVAASSFGFDDDEEVPPQGHAGETQPDGSPYRASGRDPHQAVAKVGVSDDLIIIALGVIAILSGLAISFAAAQ